MNTIRLIHHYHLTIEIEYPDKSFITIEYDGNISTGKK
jgi:hypothetical protein